MSAARRSKKRETEEIGTFEDLLALDPKQVVSIRVLSDAESKEAEIGTFEELLALDPKQVASIRVLSDAESKKIIRHAKKRKASSEDSVRPSPNHNS